MGRSTVKISHRAYSFRSRGWPQFVGNRSGETVFGPTTPAASTAASTAAGPPLAVGGLIATGKARLFLALVLVALGVVGYRTGAGLGRDMRCVMFFALIFVSWTAFTRLAGAATPPAPPLALVTIAIGRTGAIGRRAAGLTGNGIVGKPLALLGFHSDSDSTSSSSSSS